MYSEIAYQPRACRSPGSKYHPCFITYYTEINKPKKKLKAEEKQQTRNPWVIIRDFSCFAITWIKLKSHTIRSTLIPDHSPVQHMQRGSTTQAVTLFLIVVAWKLFGQEVSISYFGNSKTSCRSLEVSEIWISLVLLSFPGNLDKASCDTSREGTPQGGTLWWLHHRLLPNHKLSDRLSIPWWQWECNLPVIGQRTTGSVSFWHVYYYY